VYKERAHEIEHITEHAQNYSLACSPEHAHEHTQFKNLMCSAEHIPEHALEHIMSTTKNVTNKIRTCSAEHILEHAQ